MLIKTKYKNTTQYVGSISARRSIIYQPALKAYKQYKPFS